ncbi:DUF4252 domain-containing protein [Maribacter sp. MJ134]|uniref:DUF4252 domain-containing protein n=1 Tax=Maribacter sp. MJ134 TaxID=2496865 RepID=UPI000F8388BB|nr:DUF4252 domain-containing protein [Maribacter sp. MJ134]AZQ57909.1 DUF4252 domain-containing protein [Maribacter sp. MJ134]
MKKIIRICLLLMLVIVSSCSSTQSLQEYYVDNSENPNFLSFDIPTSLLNLEEAELTSEQRSAFESLKKLNILAFKKTLDNVAAYKTEKANVKAILANDDYTELMKMNTEFGKAAIRYKGEEDAIDEVIIFGDNKETGFALVRVLGKEMNPAHFVQLLQALQKSDFNGEGLGDLGNFFKGK